MLSFYSFKNVPPEKNKRATSAVKMLLLMTDYSVNVKKGPLSTTYRLWVIVTFTRARHGPNAEVVYCLAHMDVRKEMGIKHP